MMMRLCLASAHVQVYHEASLYKEKLLDREQVKGDEEEEYKVEAVLGSNSCVNK